MLRKRHIAREAVKTAILAKTAHRLASRRSANRHHRKSGR